MAELVLFNRVLTPAEYQAMVAYLSAKWLGVGNSLDGVLSDSSAVTVGPNGTLDLAGAGERIGTLTGSGVITSSVTATAALTVPDGSFSGTIQDGGAGKVVAVTKVTSGTLTLSGNNSYSGATHVPGRDAGGRVE